MIFAHKYIALWAKIISIRFLKGDFCIFKPRLHFLMVQMATTFSETGPVLRGLQVAAAKKAAM